MSTTKEQITKIIKTLGIPANLKGYQYLRYTIELLLTENNKYDTIMQLYRKTGNALNVTVQNVERNIRHAIHAGWIRADKTFIQELFGNTVDTEKEYPTNSEFIYTIADYITEQQENTK